MVTGVPELSNGEGAVQLTVAVSDPCLGETVISAGHVNMGAFVSRKE